MGTGQQTVGTKDDALDLHRRGHAGKYDIGRTGHFGCGLGLDRALCNQIIHGRTIAMAEDRQRMAVEQYVLGCTVPHQPNANIPDPHGAAPS